MEPRRAGMKEITRKITRAPMELFLSCFILKTFPEMNTTYEMDIARIYFSIKKGAFSGYRERLRHLFLLTFHV